MYFLAIYIAIGMSIMLILTVYKDQGDFRYIAEDDKEAISFHGLCSGFKKDDFW